MNLSADGITVDVPDGWDGRIFRRTAPGTPDPAVLHVANFALPTKRGDFGSGAVEIMGATNVLVCLLEYEMPTSGTGLFATDGVPRRVSPDAFAIDTLQRPIAGQSGMQAFAREAGRAWCLYVVLGSHRARQALASEANRVLTTLQLSAR